MPSDFGFCISVFGFWDVWNNFRILLIDSPNQEVKVNVSGFRCVAPGGKASMDHHLNSVHLELPRREEFRKARARLLDACGDQTRYAVNNPNSVAAASDSKTIIQNLENRLPNGVSYALMDKDAVYPLKIGLNTIGRLPDNDVVLVKYVGCDLQVLEGFPHGLNMANVTG